MDTIALSSQQRDTTQTNNALRKSNLVPCIVYGNETDNVQIMCDYNTLFKVYAKAGESTVIDLEVNGKTLPVLIHAIDFDPVSDRIIHVDFYAVNLKKAIEANVPLHFVGVSPAVKDEGGVLVTIRDHVTVECLPRDLPHAIDVDISAMVEFDVALHVSDIIVPKGVTILDESDTGIATVQQPRSAVEASAEATAPAAAATDAAATATSTPAPAK
jgi:large subunit ribosomal protein L25